MRRVLLTEVAPGGAEGLRRLLSSTGEVEVVGCARDGLEAARMCIQLRPDAVLVPKQLPGVAGLDVCRIVSMAAPDVGCILLEPETAEGALRQAMLAGARAVVSPDGDLGKLLKAISEMSRIRAVRDEPEYQIATDPSRMPTTIGLVSAKDGVGKTTISVNLATALAKRYPEQVVLVDFYAQLGDVALSLNMRPRASLVDLAAFSSDLDAEVVESALLRHDTGLRVLAGCSVPQPVWLDTLDVTYIATLLGILRRTYRYILCEIPPLLWPASLYALSTCQRVLVVTSLFDLPTVRDTATLVQMLGAEFAGPDRIKILVNRASRRDTYPASDLESATGRKVSFEVPNDSHTVVSSFNEGVPFVVSAPGAQISIAIERVARELLNELGTAHLEQAA